MLNENNFIDHFTTSIEEKQNDTKIYNKVYDKNIQSIREIITKNIISGSDDMVEEYVYNAIKQDFEQALLNEIFHYKKYKRFNKYSEDYTEIEYKYHLKYVEYVEYTSDQKFNNFITYVFTIYPIFFAGIQQTKNKPNPVTIDKSLKYLFLEDIRVKNYKTAVEILLKKQKYNDDNDELMKTLNSLHNESSLSDLDSILLDDIKLNVNKDKVDIMKLKTYLKKEILLRIKNNHNEKADVNSKIIEEDKKLALSELEQALEDGKSMEDFWDSF